MLAIQANVTSIAHSAVLLSKLRLNIKRDDYRLNKVLSLEDGDVPVYHCLKTTKGALSEVRDLNEGVADSIFINTVEGYWDNSEREFIHKTSNGNNVILPTTNSLVTGEFSDDGVPLFYGHKLPTSLAGVSIERSDGTLVDPSRYKILEKVDSADALHPTLHSVVAHSFSSKVREHYWVVYADSQGVVSRSLLNTEPLFSLADNLSLNKPYSENANGSLLEYWTSPSTNGLLFKLPTDYVKISRRYSDSSLLRPLKTKKEASEGDAIRLWNFSIFDSGGTNTSIVEWSRGTFIESRMKKKDRERIDVDDKHFLSCEEKGVVESYTSSVSSVTTYLELELFNDNEDIPDKVLTNSKSLEGTAHPFFPSVFYEFEEMSVSYSDSLIFVKQSILDYSYAYASYAYESHTFEFEGLELNPFVNSGLLGKRVVVYHVPLFAGQERSIEYLIVGRDGIVEYSSQSEPASNGNKDVVTDTLSGMYYEKPKARGSSSAPAFFVNVSSVDSFVSKYAGTRGCLVLGEYDFPRTLDEPGATVMTDIRKEVNESLDANLSALKADRLAKGEGVVSLPYLSGVTLTRLHWFLFSDYNKESLFSIEDLEERFSRMVPVGVDPLVSLMGVPELYLDLEKSFSIATKQFTTSWIPVVRPPTKEKVSGDVYTKEKSEDPYSLLQTIDDLSRTKSLTITSPTDSLVLQVKPYITVDTVKVFGPESNELLISFV